MGETKDYCSESGPDVRGLRDNLTSCLDTADYLGLDLVAIHIDMALNRLVPERSGVVGTTPLPLIA